MTCSYLCLDGVSGHTAYKCFGDSSCIIAVNDSCQSMCDVKQFESEMHLHTHISHLVKSWVSMLMPQPSFTMSYYDNLVMSLIMLYRF